MSHSTHSSDELVTQLPMDDPEPGSTWFVSLAGTIVFIVTVVVLCVFYFSHEGEEERQYVIDPPIKAVEDAKASQRTLLAEYSRYLEEAPDGKAVERIRIPISRAMEVFVAQQAGMPRPRVSASADEAAGADIAKEATP